MSISARWGLRLSRLLLLQSRSWSRSGKEGDQRGGDEEEFLREGDTCGVEVGYANARGRGCGSGSDAESRRNETSDRWRAPRHGEETSENGGESDIVDAKEREMFSLKDSEGKITHAYSTAALAIVSRSIIVANSTPAFSVTPGPPPTAMVRPLRSLSARSRLQISSSLCLRSRSVSAWVSPSLARRISSFFSSTKLCGMPAGEVCASIRKF
jgi:hypothetical protein